MRLSSTCALLKLALCILLQVPISSALAAPVKPVVGPRPALTRHYRPENPVPGFTAEYVTVRAYCTELLQRFSPKAHYYVGMGHSPAKLVAFLKVLSPELIATFPASGLGDSDKRDLIDRRFEAYRAHFEALLPDRVLHGTRTIQLLDWSAGSSPENLRHALKRYLEEIGSPAKVETTTFWHGSFATDHRLVGGAHDGWAAYDGREEIAEYEYASHHIGVDPIAGLKLDTTRWPQRMEKYRNYMAADRELDTFLRTHLGDMLAPEVVGGTLVDFE